MLPAQRRDVSSPSWPLPDGCCDVPERNFSKKRDPGALSFSHTVTVINPQYRALDFAKLSRYSYSSKIDKDHFNLALFSYGSLRHLLAFSDGTLSPVSKIEFVSRLQHLVNVFACLGSSITSYDHQSFNEALEYNSCVLHSIETGLKDWCTLSRLIDSTCWTFRRSVANTKCDSNVSPQQYTDDLDQLFIGNSDQPFSDNSGHLFTAQGVAM